ncbi:MAG: 2-phospho-L-lactate transferase [Ilumatobacteraceae bacterium]
MILVLAGGVGAARFLRGLIRVAPAEDITVVVNTGDDTVMHGLNISPDLDTITYTLAGAIDPERGWGLAGESWRVMESLQRYEATRPEGSQAGGTWFGLGDRDLATHLYRTARRREGASLSAVTAEITRAWDIPVRILPMSDDPVATMVDIVGIDGPRTVSFQEYFVQLRHAVPVSAVTFHGHASAAPTFLELIDRAESIIVAPSNPIVSLGPIRSLRGVDDALHRHRRRTVAISPIVAGAALKGPADRMLRELGHEASVAGIAALYTGIAATLVIDRADEAHRQAVESAGMQCAVTDTIMSDIDITMRLAETALEATRTGEPR